MQNSECRIETGVAFYRRDILPRTLHPFVLLALSLALTTLGCSRAQRGAIETTGYCPCGECNGYDGGGWNWFKLRHDPKRINYGNQKGQKYTARTAGGGTLRVPDPGILSTDSLKKPWKIPIRILLFPWMLGPDYGTIAADTRHYPFGTKMKIPGWGTGIVDDRGGAIKGPDRLDLYFPSHKKCNAWGRRNVEVKIKFPD